MFNTKVAEVPYARNFHGFSTLGIALVGEHQMANFGNRLKRERESRKISLDEVAKATKISKRYLSELEEERFKNLPGGIFNKGFVRAYAKFLGLNEGEMVAEYVAADATAFTEANPPVALETTKLMVSMAVAKEREESVRPSDPAAKFLALAVVLAAVLGVAAYGYKFYEEQSQAATAVAEVSQPSPHPAVDPASSALKSAVTQRPAKPGKPIFVELHAKADSWMQVSVDGRAPVEMILSADNSRSFSAENQLVVKLGNAEGIEITRNGRLLPAFAPGTKTQTLTFTPEL